MSKPTKPTSKSNIKELSITNTYKIEGLLNFTFVEDKDKKSLVWSTPLKGVIVPIILNNAGENYFLMVSQSRIVLNGKVGIEVNRGFINEETVDDTLRWNYLLTRKVPFLSDYANIIKVVELGYYWLHPDLCDFQNPVQAVFAKTREPMDIAELKKALKVRHDYYNEPATGPRLHNTEPVLRSIAEVEQRLNSIFEKPYDTQTECYINDLFSLIALNQTLSYIKLHGLPF